MIPRQYLIIPETSGPGDLAQSLATYLCENDVACVLVEGTEKAKLSSQINTLRSLCTEKDIAILIKERFDWVKELGADGVHISTDRKTLKSARQALGDAYSIGADAGISRHEAMVLGEAGADYIAFSGAENQQIEEMCNWWFELFQTPCVAFFQDNGHTINHKAKYDFYVTSLKG